LPIEGDERSQPIVAVKVDATHDDDPATDVVKDRYGVVGSDRHPRRQRRSRAHPFHRVRRAERFLTAIREID